MSTLHSSNIFTKIDSRIRDMGFDLVGWTKPHVSEKDQSAYQDWCEQGKAAGMDYMVRNKEGRINPTLLYPDTTSILTLGVSYFQGPWPEKPGTDFGRVARYAWGKDYHDVIQRRLSELLIEIKKIAGFELKAELAVDTKPLLERALARQAGLGFVGKNTILIAPRSNQFHVGSYVFLAEILFSGLPDFPESSIKEMNGCGSCTKCLDSCPTNAFEGPHKLNAGKCIAYLTIENKGWIDRSMRPFMADWVFGCDVCQDVCPFNVRAKETQWPEFQPNEGVGPWISLRDLFTSVTPQDFNLKWKGTPLIRPRRKGMIRNACIVAGNSNDASLIPDLKNFLVDPEPVIRGHAVWALSRLMGSSSYKTEMDRFWKQESDQLVKEEYEWGFENGI